jgi:outer membrane protein TolC
LEIAGENLQVSTYSYNEGRATLLEVLQAQISWMQIYTNAITARFNYAVAVSAYMRLAAEF